MRKYFYIRKMSLETMKNIDGGGHVWKQREQREGYWNSLWRNDEGQNYLYLEEFKRRYRPNEI